MNKILRAAVLTLSIVAMSCPTFAYTLVDTTDVQGLTSTNSNGDISGITNVKYYSDEEQQFLDNGGDIDDLEVTKYLSGNEAAEFLVSTGFLSSTTCEDSIRNNDDYGIAPIYYLEDVEQYSQYGSNVNVYATLTGTIRSNDGNKWTYTRASLGGVAYNSDTFVSAKKKSGGTGYTYCKSTHTFKNPQYGNYSFDATFYAGE